MGRLIFTGAVAALLAVAGCMLVTGSTDGYAEVDAGCGCATAEVCCIDVDAETTKCSAACDDPSTQLCGSSEECGDAGACVPQTCSVFGQKLPISTCGTLVGCQLQ